MKRCLIVCLILCLIAPITIEAKKKSLGNGLYWELSDDGILTISGNGPMTNWWHLKSKNRPWHKNKDVIKEVIIENGVTSIGARAFTMCNNLISVVISNTVVSIGECAFYECGLSSIAIPNSITTIGNYAFSGCEKLSSLVIPNSVMTIEECAFIGCKKLTSVVIPNSITSIEDWTFAGCALSSIVFPNSVETIGNSAFRNCDRLTSVVFPSSLKTIRNSAFSGCNRLTSVVFLNNKTIIEEYAFDNGVTKYQGETLSLPVSTENGNDFYIVKDYSGEGKGIIGSDGNWIIPLDKNYSNICAFGDKYVKIRQNSFYSIITPEGKEIIPISRGYTSIGDFNTNNRTFSFTKKGYTGVCNEQGEEISLTKLPPAADDIIEKGGFASAVELNNGSTKYWKVSKNGRYGLTDAEGKAIVPTEMEALESAGTGYLRYKLNGFWGLMNYTGTIIIDTDRGYTSIGDFKTFNKRFPYTMTGYKGECDINGKEISKIKVETPPQQQVVVTQEQTPQKQEEDKKVEVIVKQQQWIPCTDCGGTGRCKYCDDGWVNFGNGFERCWVCMSLKGVCMMCRGSRGHYE